MNPFQRSARSIHRSARSNHRSARSNHSRALVLAFLALGALSTSGCFSFNWAHNRRHIKVVFDDIAELHRDVDKTIFGLDRYPAEK